jgi:DNA-binding NtrC family response regulator
MAAEARGSVLVVDDEPELARALCDLLADAGFRAKGANTPEEALALLEGGGFDVVLTDLQMPGSDGTQLLRTAHQIDPAVAGVVMTGVGADQLEVPRDTGDAPDCIFKPFRLQQVTSVLERAIAVRRDKVRGGPGPTPRVG